MSTIKELRNKAKSLGMTNYSKLSKPDLVHAINMVMVESRKMPTMADLRGLAQDLKIEGYGKLKKVELIHQIQVAEGHAACYQRIPDCGQMDCLFRPNCLP